MLLTNHGLSFLKMANRRCHRATDARLCRTVYELSTDIASTPIHSLQRLTQANAIDSLVTVAIAMLWVIWIHNRAKRYAMQPCTRKIR